MNARCLAVVCGLTTFGAFDSPWAQIVTVHDEACVRNSVVRCLLEADGSIDGTEYLMYNDAKVGQVRDNPRDSSLLIGERNRYWDGLDPIVGKPGQAEDRIKTEPGKSPKKTDVSRIMQRNIELCLVRARLDPLCMTAVDSGTTTAVNALRTDLSSFNSVLNTALGLLTKTVESLQSSVKEQSELVKKQSELIESLKKQIPPK